MRRKIVAGNWKMNKSVPEALELIRSLKAALEAEPTPDVEVVVCPPFVDLVPVQAEIEGSGIQLGAQNVFWEESGAYTGEVSVAMLASAGCEYVIIGHSERRQYFGETDVTVNRRLHRALAGGLKPILCVGESLEQRQRGLIESVVGKQVRDGLNGVSAEGMERVVIAYEPVWAIGTGVNATPEQAQEVHSYIRRLLGEMYGKEVGRGVRIQYGGSVNPANAADLMAQKDVDGALVGGASLRADSFHAILKAASNT